MMFDERRSESQRAKRKAEMLEAVLAKADRRRRQRVARRAGAVCVLVAGVAAWSLMQSAPQPRAIESVVHAPVEERLVVVREIGDDELVQLLAEAGEPAGLAVTAEGATLVPWHTSGGGS